MEDYPQYPCVILALDILGQSKELKKSVLLNRTISMHSVIKSHAESLKDPKYAEDQVAMWTLVISPDPLVRMSNSAAIVCNMHGKYIDCLRAAVCFKPVCDLMYALNFRELSNHIYLMPVLTAYPPLRNRNEYERPRCKD
jgi:hypothetical protein